VVFAQLEFDGKEEGIHAFLVRIREPDHSISKGVKIEDMGKKVKIIGYCSKCCAEQRLQMECNGVDNGKLWFDHVRVPREALLNRWSDVDEQGRYSSVIANKRG